jgi:PAS domain S-box-containing protein
LSIELKQRIAQRTAQLEAVNEELRARNRQQAAVAAVGQAAIRSRDLTAVMDEAAARVAETLGTEFCAVAEWLPDEDGFRVRAGVGWKPGIVGTLVPTADAPVGEYLLRSGEPIVTFDARTETRFPISRGMIEHGIVSQIAVILRGRSRVWGLLAAHSKHPRSFSPDDVDFLQSVANVLALAVERHDVEMAQQREQEALEAIFSHTPVMISMYDAAGRLLRVNPEWERTLGWTFEEAQRVDILAECYPDPEARAAVLDFTKRSDRRWADFRPTTRSGRVIDATWIRFALSDGTRIGFGIDLTERRQAAAALAESETRFAKIFQACPVALGMSTIVEGRILDVNERWLELFGYGREEVIGRTGAELGLAVHGDERATIVKRARTEGVLRNIEMQVRRKSGDVCDLIVSAVPIHLGQEKESWLSAQVDITERKRAEAERDRLLESERNARAEAEGTLDKLRAIQAITDRALGHLGLDALLHELLSRLRQALGADRAALSLVDEERQVLYTRAVEGMDLEAVASVLVPRGKGVTGRIWASGRPLTVNDLAGIDLSGIENLPVPGRIPTPRAVAGAPLHVGEKVIGVVTVASDRPREFTKDELDLLLLVADRVAPAIEQSRLMETVRAAEERLTTLSRRLMAAQEEERRRLAVELHDELGQALTAVKINLESVQRSSGEGLASGPLAGTIACVDQAMQRVRDLALDLRPSVLDDLGLPAALRWYADRFARDAHMDVHLSIDAVPHLDTGVETACFRVAQEALTNVVRHAQARHVWLDLRLLAEGLELRVRDDGIGFDAPAARKRALRGASMGLLGMEERVSLLGGEYEIRTRPREGTEVRARFSLRDHTRRPA